MSIFEEIITELFHQTAYKVVTVFAKNDVLQLPHTNRCGSPCWQALVEERIEECVGCSQR